VAEFVSAWVSDPRRDPTPIVVPVMASGRNA
jgi:hypothetical protein